MDYDYTHPENFYKDLIYLPEGKTTEEAREKVKNISRAPPDTNTELCWSCGWNTYHQETSSYGSRIRIFHTRGNMGLWTLGSQLMILDQPNNSLIGNDYITQEFIRNRPGLKQNIPLVEKMQRLSAPTDQIHFTLMSRAQGVGLDLVWPTLSREQKSNYKDQLASCIKKLRESTSPVAQKVDGSPLDDVIIGNCLRRRPPTCKKIGHTTDEWFDNLAEDLRHGLSRIHKTKNLTIIEEKLQELKHNFPKGERYVLTHGDLNLSNIIVKNDKIEAIIDWEMSGYFPWWAERWLSLRWGTNESDELFEPLWADIDLEMDEDAFQKEVFQKVGPVIDAWEECQVEHPHKNRRFLRPGFCKCQPYGGVINWSQLGNEVEHKIEPIDWEIEEGPDPGDPMLRDGYPWGG